MLTIRIDTQAVALGVEGERYASGPHGGVTHALRDALWWFNLERRSRFVTMPGVALGPDRRSSLERRLAAVGTQLGADFLPGDVGTRFRDEIDAAKRYGRSLRIALEITDSELANLPWEALIPPGRSDPLVLERGVELYRSAGTHAPVTEPNIPGPLRILAVLAAPVGPGSRPDLDLEREHQLIVSAIAEARKEGKAYVRVLDQGTVEAVQEALNEQPFHVLHIACHAGPGMLLLEDEGGGVARVAGRELIGYLPANRIPPLIVLAGCSTALVPGQDPENDRAVEVNKMAGLAWELSTGGVPAVVAMTAPVTDRYAQSFCSRLYEELAPATEKGALPDVLAAVAAARRHVEEKRLALPAGSREAELVEWATPALYLTGSPRPLFDPRHPYERIEQSTHSPLPDDALRPIGYFVGRRAEMRVLLNALGSATCSGVLLYGIGGVGKSSLAAEAVRKLGNKAGIVVRVSGQTGPESILKAIAQELNDQAATGPDHRSHLLALSSTDQRKPWRERFSTWLRTLLDQESLLLLLDNFEDNLTRVNGDYRLTDPELADLLSLWMRQGGRSRLIITSRYPFSLPGDDARRPKVLAIGPLSLAETIRLIWRLPAVDALERAQLSRVWSDVGGHPRTLEYLEALMQGGQARFDDVTRRMERLLRDRKELDPAQWLRCEREFNEALADAVALTADDALLASLLDDLEDFTRRVFVGAAVYRRPVDDFGVAWPVSRKNAVDPALRRRFDGLFAGNDLNAILEKMAAGDWAWLAAGDREQLKNYMTQLAGPPIVAPERLPASVGRLIKIGVLCASRRSDGRDCYFVHRWIVTTFLSSALCDPADLKAAHKAASAYWQWLAAQPPKGRSGGLHYIIDNAIGCFMEAIYHLEQAGETSEAAYLAQGVSDRLAERGDWGPATGLFDRALAWAEPGTREYATLQQRQGERFLDAGDTKSAERCQRTALEILEELGDEEAVAACQLHLGIIAARSHDYAKAEECIDKSAAIYENLNIRSGLMATQRELGTITEQRGDYRGARVHYERARQISEGLEDRDSLVVILMNLAGIAYQLDGPAVAEDYYLQAQQKSTSLDNRSRNAMILSNLGAMALERQDLASAETRFRKALDAFYSIGDRIGIGNVLYHLGMVAHARHDLSRAKDYYNRSLTMRKELGDRAGSAKCLHQLGIVAHNRGDLTTAEELLKQARDTNLQIGNRAAAAMNIGQLGQIAYVHQEYARAEKLYRTALATFERVGDRAGIAKLKRMMGDLARARGEYDIADENYRAALAIFAELGDAENADMVERARIENLAKQMHRGGLDDGLRRFIEICERDGHPKEAGIGWMGLGDQALLREDYAVAAEYFGRALTIFRSLGEHRLVAKTLSSLAAAAAGQNDIAGAEEAYQRSLAVWEQLGDLSEIARIHHYLGRMAERRKDYPAAIRSWLLSLEIDLQLSRDIRQNTIALHRIRNHLGRGRFSRIVTEQRNAVAADQINAGLDAFSSSNVANPGTPE